MRPTTRVATYCLPVGFALGSVACATVIKGSGRAVEVTSMPSGATILVDGEPRGETPETVYFQNGRDYHLMLQKPGFVPAGTVVTSSFSGHSLWLLPYSTIIDALAGNITTVDQGRVSMTLHAMPAPVAARLPPAPPAAAAPSPVDAPPAWASGPELKVAVLEFANDAGLSEFEIRSVADMVRGAALGLPTRRLFVLTRENILELLPPGTDLGTCVGDCEVETGRNVGAHLVVSGQVGRFGTRLQVVMKMHDTRTGRLLASRSISGATLDDLEPLLVKAGETLFRDALRPEGEGTAPVSAAGTSG